MKAIKREKNRETTPSRDFWLHPGSILSFCQPRSQAHTCPVYSGRSLAIDMESSHLDQPHRVWPFTIIPLSSSYTVPFAWKLSCFCLEIPFNTLLKCHFLCISFPGCSRSSYFYFTVVTSLYHHRMFMYLVRTWPFCTWTPSTESMSINGCMYE